MTDQEAEKTLRYIAADKCARCGVQAGTETDNKVWVKAMVPGQWECVAWLCQKCSETMEKNAWDIMSMACSKEEYTP